MEVASCNQRAPTWHVPEFGGGATCDVAPNIFLPAYRIMEDLDRFEPEAMSWYVLNIGAHDGISGDPFYNALVRNPTKWKGLAIEPGPAINTLRKNYARFAGIDLWHMGVTATDVARTSKARSPNTSGKTIDYLKLDIDSCDCHVLRTLMDDPYYHAKVLQVELNHHLPPPIMYMDMCKNNVHGTSNPGNTEVFGCSMAAAFDIVEPLGYKLLQYDWPDATFIQARYQPVFPCILNHGLDHNYKVGYRHAREHFDRFLRYVPNKQWVLATPELGRRAERDPRGALEEIIARYRATWVKPQLWIMLGVLGTSVRATVLRDRRHGGICVIWHNTSWSPEWGQRPHDGDCLQHPSPHFAPTAHHPAAVVRAVAPLTAPARIVPDHANATVTVTVTATPIEEETVMDRQAARDLLHTASSQPVESQKFRTPTELVLAPGPESLTKARRSAMSARSSAAATTKPRYPSAEAMPPLAMDSMSETTRKPFEGRAGDAAAIERAQKLKACAVRVVTAGQETPPLITQRDAASGGYLLSNEAHLALMDHIEAAAIVFQDDPRSLSVHYGKLDNALNRLTESKDFSTAYMEAIRQSAQVMLWHG